ncbi:MAG: hypothetical protein V7K57_10565 [Nostoc sp.]
MTLLHRYRPSRETRTHDWFPYGSFLQIKPDSYSYAQTQQTSESEFDYNSEKE